MKFSFSNFGKFNAKNWILSGLVYGFLLLIIINLILPLISGDEISLQKIFLGIPFYAIAGLGYGYLMKITFYRD